LKVYGNTIGNFIVNHMPFGGIYLIGSVTKSFYPYIQRFDILEDFKARHPEMKKLV
jgi:glucokinase